MEKQSSITNLHRNGILLLLGLAGMLGPLSSSSYYPALNVVKQSLKTTDFSMDITVSAFLFSMAIAPIFWGTWADNYGRRMPFLISNFIFTLASCGCALSYNIEILIFCRIMQGIGSAAALAVSMGCLSDLFPREERGKALGIFSTGPLIGPLIGPLLGGVINEYLGWRSIFWMNAGLAAGLLLGLLILLPETLAQDRRQPFPSIKLQFNPSLSLERTGRIPNPLTPLSYFKYTKVILTAFYSCILVATFYAIAVSQSTILAPKYNLNSAQAGLTYLPLGFGDMFGAIFGGRVADWTLQLANRKYNPKPAPAESRLPGIFPTIFLISGSLLSVGFCLHYNVSLYITMLCEFLTTAAMAFTFGLMVAYVLDLFPLHAASISAACNLVRSMSAGIVTSINAILFRHLGFIGTFGLLASLQIIGILIFTFLMIRGSHLEPNINNDSATISVSVPSRNPPPNIVIPINNDLPSHSTPNSPTAKPIYSPSTHSLFLSSMHNISTIPSHPLYSEPSHSTPIIISTQESCPNNHLRQYPPSLRHFENGKHTL